MGSITGIRLHWPTVKASDRNMQMVANAVNGLTLGATNLQRMYSLVTDKDDELSPLGLSLQWTDQGEDGDDMKDRSIPNETDAPNTHTLLEDTTMEAAGGFVRSGKTTTSTKEAKTTAANSMTTHLVRGMPYATMEYTGHVIPSLTAGNELTLGNIDQTSTLKCGSMRLDPTTKKPVEFGHIASQTVQSEILLHFKESDFTWMVLFSRPVKITCNEAPKNDGPGIIPETMFQLFVEESEEPLTVRVALVNECTTGKSDVKDHCDKSHQMKDVKGYADLLRKHAGWYPLLPKLEIEAVVEYDKKDDMSRLTFDWNVKSFGSNSASKDESKPLLMFALPHHQLQLNGSDSKLLTDYCKPTFHGSTCLVQGPKWMLQDTLGKPQAWIGERPPEASAIPDLAKALKEDIQFRLSDNLHRAAIDTYFSGKILAKLGRILLIATELKHLAGNGDNLPNLGKYQANDKERYSLAQQASKKVDLPSSQEISDGVEELKQGVEIWINGKGEAPFVYDATWGGLINCGCKYTIPNKEHPDKGYCKNKFPDCPALEDVNVNFGNGYYNDHHFHYGYHVYAAAVAAKFDPDWGRTWHEKIMLYIRDFANPSTDDPYFPAFRQKDWFLGSSWASGIVSANTPHGRNQESSSESIAAYEGMSLYGDAMMDAFEDKGGDKERAQQIRDIGRLLTAMEIWATQLYWHVWNSTTHVSTYPNEYRQPVVGMLYETMASFQTWFDGGDMASIGIQLLPFTPVAERRDDPEWASVAYEPFEKSCFARADFCVENGWSILLCGLKATNGDRTGALKQALEIPSKVFLSEGGSGHSRSNLIWYVATRPDVHVSSTQQHQWNSTIPAY